LRRIEDDSIIKKVGVRLEKNFKDLDDKIGAVLMFVVLVITFLNVVSRYLIHASFSFTEELTSVIFVLISLLGASIATKNVGHFALDLLTNYMPPKAKAICKVLSDLISLILCAVIAVLSIKMVIHQYGIGSISTSMHIPQWIYGLTVPVGMFFMTFRYIQRLCASCKELIKGDKV